VSEAGSAVVRRLLAGGAASTSRLSEVEVASALARRAREHAFSVRARDRALAALETDFASLYIVELVPEVTATARVLLLRRQLRASDAVHLPSCLFLQRELGSPVPLVVFDERLKEAAAAEAVPVLP
jgi:hypothetical protein